MLHSRFSAASASLVLKSSVFYALGEGCMAFEETKWSLVHRAASNGTEAKEALATLCQMYWPPLYSFLRARGHSKENASDLLQGFFLVLIEKNFIQIARPE